MREWKFAIIPSPSAGQTGASLLSYPPGFLS
jgi:hypothetical protein